MTHSFPSPARSVLFAPRLVCGLLPFTWGAAALWGLGCGPGSTLEPSEDAQDITDAIFTNRSADCADYAGEYTAGVTDLQREMSFTSTVIIEAGDDSCTLLADTIPNHDFNDSGASFATAVSEIDRSYTIPRLPSAASTTTALSQQTFDAVLLNGVVVDMLSAGCYRPNDPMADPDGNVPIGCSVNDPWLLDPLGTPGGFGTDAHNAHVQPDGTYHYHGDPMALFDDNPGAEGSPVIGFAADGFPIYGPYFVDPDTTQVRRAESGYTLKGGSRPSGANDPGGAYDGMYVDDYEHTGAGDLDACNGMTTGGQYGYYVTNTYPWLVKCHQGAVDASFRK